MKTPLTDAVYDSCLMSDTEAVKKLYEHGQILETKLQKSIEALKKTLALCEHFYEVPFSKEDLAKELNALIKELEK